MDGQDVWDARWDSCEPRLAPTAGANVIAGRTEVASLPPSVAAGPTGTKLHFARMPCPTGERTSSMNARPASARGALATSAIEYVASVLNGSGTSNVWSSVATRGVTSDA